MTEKRARSLLFIGGGNMAQAIISGLIRSMLPYADAAAGPALRIAVVDPSHEALASLQQIAHNAQASGPEPRPSAFSLESRSSISELEAETLMGLDLIVLAVKPQLMREICLEAGPRLPARATIVSIAAGVSGADINRWLGRSAPSAGLIRAMPNTPALIGKGITGLAAITAPQSASDHDRAQAQWLLSAVGRCVWLEDETQLDAVTAISGSGPAYFFYMIESLRDAAVALGLAHETAIDLALATAEGASALAAGSSDSVEALRAKVTSKGGTTAAGIASLEADDFKAVVARATQAAAKRSAELGTQLSGPA